MEISKEELRRALLKNCSEERLAAFENATVAICGLGGLGSNIAVMLARAGIGKLILADFDKVEISNLNRQQYKLSQIGEYKSAALCKNLKEINPFITLEAYTAAITPDNAEEILSCADIICEAFDKAENKAMLTNFVLENMPDKYLVASSGMAGFDSANKIKTRRISKRFYLCGDCVSDAYSNIGLASTRVMTCAAHQAHMILRILSGEFDA